jgi:hypothetical protein
MRGCPCIISVVYPCSSGVQVILGGERRQLGLTRQQTLPGFQGELSYGRDLKSCFARTALERLGVVLAFD